MKEKAYRLLDDIGVKYQKVEHPPLLTCEDAKKYRTDNDGLHVKNLFVQNKKKSKFFLVVLPAEKRADLKEIQEKLDETKLSFASETDLEQKLGTTRGAVSLLNIANVEKLESVAVVLDKEIMESEKVGFHPSVNTETLVFSTDAISKVLNAVNIEWKIIELKEKE